jgi:hypothetical protein
MTDEDLFNDFTSADPDLGPRMDLAKASTWLQNRLNFAASNARGLIRDASATVRAYCTVYRYSAGTG